MREGRWDVVISPWARGPCRRARLQDWNGLRARFRLECERDEAECDHFRALPGAWGTQGGPVCPGPDIWSSVASSEKVLNVADSGNKVCSLH